MKWFDITPESEEAVKLDEKTLKGELIFKVANVSGQELRARAVVVCPPDVPRSWISIKGEEVRKMPEDGEETFTVNIVADKEAKARTYSVTFIVCNQANPEEEADEVKAEFEVLPHVQPGRRPPVWPWIAGTAAAVAAVAIVVFLIWWLTRPKPVTVPSVIGKTESQATAILEGAGLSKGSVSSRVDTATTGTVIEQQPNAGEQVSRDTAIALVLAEEREVPPVTVPSLIGRTESQASEILRRAGLRKGNITSRVAAAKPGTVIEQQPNAREQVSRGTAIALVLAKPRVREVRDHRRRLQVNATPFPSTVAPGQKSTITVTVSDEQGRAVAGAKVTVSAGGGKFLPAANTPYEPRARLHSPYSATGVTGRNGRFLTWWVCNPCAAAYQLGIKVSKDGFGDGEGETTIRIRQ